MVGTHVADPFLAPIFHTRKRSRALISPGEWQFHQTIIATKENSDLPLLIKDVPKLDWLYADAFIIKHGTPAEISAWFNLTLIYRDVKVCEKAFGSLPSSNQPVFLSLCDIEKLVEHKCLVEILDLESVGSSACCSFAVLEAPKSRRRWILWPREYNDSISSKDLSYGGTIVFPTAEQIINKFASFAFAVTVDFKTYFQQFTMELGCALHFPIWKDGRVFIPTTVPTGAREPPMFGHLLTSIIVRVVVASFSPLHDSVRLSETHRSSPRACGGDGFADNVRLLANSHETCNQLTQKLFDICSSIGITINEKIENCTPSTNYVYLGIVFDHVKHTVDIADKTKTKIAEFQLLINSETELTGEQLLAGFGVLVWASCVLAVERYPRYVVYKFMRRCIGAAGSTEAALTMLFKVWPCSLPIWNSWAAELSAGTGRRVYIQMDSIPIFWIVTDSSLDGWGGIVFSSGGWREAIFAGVWPPAFSGKHINYLELRTIREVLLRFVPEGQALTQRCIINITVDNTSTKFQLRKRSSKIFAYNQELGNLIALLDGRQWVIGTVRYIKTKNNPADFLTRLSAEEMDVVFLNFNNSSGTGSHNTLKMRNFIELYVYGESEDKTSTNGDSEDKTSTYATSDEDQRQWL